MIINKKTYVWGIPTRLFHWLLVIALVGAYLANEDNLTLHAALGYMAGLLVMFRLLYGVVGPRYSHFRDFSLSPGSQFEFLKSLTRRRPHTGHNPPASLIMLCIMIVVLIVALTGLFTLAQEGQQGLFASLTMPATIDFKELHEVCVNILIVLVILHLTGILTDLVLHKSDSALKSVFTGYKTGVEGEDARLSGIQKFFGFAWILVPLSAFLFTISGPALQVPENREKTESSEINEEMEAE